MSTSTFTPNRPQTHFQEHIAKYATLAVAILTPTAGLLGSAAADLGGADTKVGHALIGAASALGAAVAGITYIRNLGIWQMLDKFGIAPGIAAATKPPMFAVGPNQPAVPLRPPSQISSPTPAAGVLITQDDPTTPYYDELTETFSDGVDDEPGDNFDGLPHHPVTDPAVVPPDAVNMPNTEPTP
jgi:hypothetical protein